MNLFSLRISTEIAGVLTTALLHFIWQGAVLPLILISLVKILGVKTIRVRYLLSVGMLMAMGLAPLLTMALQRGTTAPTPAVEPSGPSNIVVNDQTATISGINLQWRQVSDVLRRPDVEAVIKVWIVKK